MQYSALLSVTAIWIHALKWGHLSSYLNLEISLPQALWGFHVFLAYFQASCVCDCQQGLLMQMRWGYSFLKCSWNFLEILIPRGQFYTIFSQPYISKIKMKLLNPTEDLSPSVSGTGNCSSVGFSQKSLWCLIDSAQACCNVCCFETSIAKMCQEC